LPQGLAKKTITSSTAARVGSPAASMRSPVKTECGGFLRASGFSRHQHRFGPVQQVKIASGEIGDVGVPCRRLVEAASRV
jgi:hypothetical protein